MNIKTDEQLFKSDVKRIHKQAEQDFVNTLTRGKLVVQKRNLYEAKGLKTMEPLERLQKGKSCSRCIAKTLLQRAM